MAYQRDPIPSISLLLPAYRNNIHTLHLTGRKYTIHPTFTQSREGHEMIAGIIMVPGKTNSKISCFERQLRICSGSVHQK
jgi:hypothetical protein